MPNLRRTVEVSSKVKVGEGVAPLSSLLVAFLPLPPLHVMATPPPVNH